MGVCLSLRELNLTQRRKDAKETAFGVRRLAYRRVGGIRDPVRTIRRSLRDAPFRRFAHSPIRYLRRHQIRLASIRWRFFREDPIVQILAVTGSQRFGLDELKCPGAIFSSFCAQEGDVVPVLAVEPRCEGELMRHEKDFYVS